MLLTGICRLGNDAEVRYTQSGRAVANLSLAWNHGRKDEQGHRASQWIEAALWGEQAEKLQAWLLKGTVLWVAIRDVHTETYEGKNGTGTKMVGTVLDLEFVPRQKRDEPTQSTGSGAKAPASEGNDFGNFEDDIPF
jgi:single-strand DNA-binding protein